MRLRSRRNGRSGFTLIELLVVIVIIAILAAIIYPVISRVQENGRQSSSISNMHDISAKLGEYILDKHQPPPVLFGYVYTDPSSGLVVPMDQVLTNLQGQPDADTLLATYLPGLYPAYINNVSEFTDSNNQANYRDITYPDINILCPSGNPACTGMPNGNLVTMVDVPATPTTPAMPAGYYAADAYDSSPQVTGPNGLADTQPVAVGGPLTNYVTRYQPAWTSVVSLTAVVNPSDPPNFDEVPDITWWPGSQYSTPPIVGSPDFTVGTGSLWSTIPNIGVDNPDSVYERQLHWQYPPASTYVTSTTYHVPNTNSVLVLFEDGSVRKFTSEQFTNRNNGDPASIAPVVSGAGAPASSANFWQLLPTGQ